MTGDALPLPDPIPLRAHNVLCLHGYRGRGYSEGFVSRMQAVHDVLTTDPGRHVRLIVKPDVLCDACPHLDGGCTLGGPDHEAHMHAQDEDVLRRLELESGAVVTWAEVTRKVAARIRGRDLGPICTTCPWLTLGWCEEGIEELRGKGPPTSP